jgi:hypothetical protein
MYPLHEMIGIIDQTWYGTVEGIEYQQGLPDLDKLDPREKHLIILEDLMHETDQMVASLFTKKKAVYIPVSEAAAAYIPRSAALRLFNRDTTVRTRT